MSSLERSPADEFEAGRQPRLPTLDADAGFPTMPAFEFFELRERCGTQAEVAIELQTARRTMGRWERGERPVPGIAAVAIRMLAERVEARRKLTAEAISDIGIKAD